MAKTSPVRRRGFGAPMTPMIDVIFLLLVFFICTASFQPLEEDLAASLAHEGDVATETLSPPKQEPPAVLIRIDAAADAASRWQVDGVACESLEAVRRAVTAKPQDAATIIAPARHVTAGDVVAIYDLCRLLQRSRIQFATKSHHD